ncbi:MAG: peptidase M14 [Verrucomicrobia bacterium]|nr:peptidase M14 [Verrucomicrobiota bacterium]
MSPAAFSAQAQTAAVGVEENWRTRAEQTDYRETARYDETMAFCRRLAAARPDAVRIETLGRSPEGREIIALVVSLDGRAFTPEAARAADKEIVFINACIHPGECEGKDAGLALLRDLLILDPTGKADGLLDQVVLLFVPIHGVDGHERFGPFNRINQNGPAEMGWRTTAQNYNLNRDWLKADAPEMHAVLDLFRRWLPDLLIDTHTTDGADYQYDLTFSLEKFANQHPAIVAWQHAAFDDDIVPALVAQGHQLAPYITLKNDRDPREGFADGAASPRFSTGYAAAQNRCGLLVETHMLKDYKTRVVATYDLIRAVLAHLAKNPGALRRATAQADADAAAGRLSQPLPLTLAADPKKSEPFSFLGVAWTRELSALSGLPWIRYDAARPETFTVPFYHDVQPEITVALPKAGYLVPAAWTVVIERLQRHGIAFTTLARPLTVEVETSVFDKVEWQPRPFENHHGIKDFQSHLERRTLTFPAGSVFVDVHQRAAKVIAHLLEPAAPDSLLRWGYLDAIFEQKEYADDYVMERVAREMLARDPALLAEFERRLIEDKEFAASASARLDFFYRRSPYFDDRLNVYPIGRVDVRPPLD